MSIHLWPEIHSPQGAWAKQRHLDVQSAQRSPGSPEVQADPGWPMVSPTRTEDFTNKNGKGQSYPHQDALSCAILTFLVSVVTFSSGILVFTFVQTTPNLIPVCCPLAILRQSSFPWWQPFISGVEEGLVISTMERSSALLETATGVRIVNKSR